MDIRQRVEQLKKYHSGNCIYLGEEELKEWRAIANSWSQMGEQPDFREICGLKIYASSCKNELRICNK